MTNTDSQEPLDQIPATYGTLSSPEGLNSRVDSSLNDPNAIAHPELTKADKALAEELHIHKATLDKSALRKLSIKQAEEAKIVAEILAARERQAFQNGSAYLSDVGDVGNAVNDRTEDAGRAEEDPRAGKARVPIDIQTDHLGTVTPAMTRATIARTALLPRNARRYSGGRLTRSSVPSNIPNCQEPMPWSQPLIKKPRLMAFHPKLATSWLRGFETTSPPGFAMRNYLVCMSSVRRLPLRARRASRRSVQPNGDGPMR